MLSQSYSAISYNVFSFSKIKTKKSCNARCLYILVCVINYLPTTSAQASDMVSTSRILVAVVQMCYEAKDWDALNENIMLLTKRRSQLKQVRYLFVFDSSQLSNTFSVLQMTHIYMLFLRPTFNVSCPLCLIRLLLKWCKNVTSMWTL